MSRYQVMIRFFLTALSADTLAACSASHDKEVLPAVPELQIRDRYASGIAAFLQGDSCMVIGIGAP